MKKEIIFFLTHKYNNQISKNIRKISQEKGDRDFCVLMHGDHDLKKNSIPVRTFSLKHLSSLNYKMVDEDTIVPGSTHLPVFCYFREFPDYDNYWVIEYDVEYGGNWEHLFNTYLASNADFVSSYITSFENEKHWPWWDLQHPSKEIPLEKRIRTFHPIYRVSNKALHFLNRELSEGWMGHSEVLMTSLLHYHDFQLLDFGENGEFSNSTYPDFYTKNFRFYSNKPARFRKIFHLGTMRYRPAMKKVGYRKLLYHPVKNDTGLTKFGEIRYLFGVLKKRVRKLMDLR